MKTSAIDPIEPQEQQARLQSASLLLREGRRHEAAAALRVLIALCPRLVDSHRLLGVALSELGDLPAAESAFRAALKLAPNEARTAIGLAEVLLGLKRAPEAVTLLRRFVNGQTSNLALLTYQGLALQAAGETIEAIDILGRATVTSPESAVAEHNFAGALVDAKRFADAETAVSRARAKGLDAAELWLVDARAQRGLGRLSEAEGRYSEALRRNSLYPLAVIELAQTVWLRGGETGAVLAILNEGERLMPLDEDIPRHRAKFLEDIGDFAGSYATLERSLATTETANLHVFAAQVAARLDPERGLAHAERALALQPENVAAVAALCQINLALGRADEAARIADDLCRRVPTDQYSWALMGVAWRMQGDPRYERLYDYDKLVAQSPIDLPAGWDDLESYLDDLAAALRPLHGRVGHPIGQSLRSGSQTEQDLANSDSPAIRAFFPAIDGPIRRYIAALGKGRDPLRGRAKRSYALSGAWSVELQPNGFHVDHVHPKGWISSAFHVELPASIDRQPEGWLKFGEPGIPTLPRLEPDHLVKPERGQLVLFPSYMWHGTVPFTGAASRLSIAFDAVPS